MLESTLQRKIIDLFAKHDILALKVESQSTTGLPDLLCWGATGEGFMVEVKQKGGRLRPMQKRVIARLRARGVDVYVVHSLDAARSIAQEKARQR